MATFKAAVIGCGGRGRAHAAGYAASPDVELVACADPNEENAKAVAERFQIPRIYADAQEMLRKERPDIVSICVWTELHLPMVEAAVEAGVRAIHAEKPMEITWGRAKKIYELVTQNGVLTTFCHQRRFEARFVKARQLINEGAIGEVLRYEGRCPNLIDWGTHWFDMFFWYNNDEPAEAVLGQIHLEGEPRRVFGVPVESQGISYIWYKNGRRGLLMTGIRSGEAWDNRILGTEGVIEIVAHADPPIRVLRSDEKGWWQPDLSDIKPQGNSTTLSVLDLVDCLKTGREPRLDVKKALQATELIFATYESSRRRGRVDLPLETEDNAFISMWEKGQIGTIRA
ncbi:MAG: hypothetical protein KatS3mg115_2248 [Candidatus Poribacteria bacterium]|nr:MAG: hypothetical protein KatS3mg115_2248 [Candidatus Poribacteria bacterium]